MKTIAAIAFILSAALAQAAEPRVAYTLAVTKPGTVETITEVRAGQEFDIALEARDLRPTSVIDGRTMFRGVFAAYVGLLYPTQHASVVSVTHVPPFTNGKQRRVLDSGLSPLGGFSGLFSGDSYPREVVRIRFRAEWPADLPPHVTEVTAKFRPILAGLRKPTFDTLLYGSLKPDRQSYYPGEQSNVNADEIELTGASVRILK
ncbi:MAG: hypothetical protein ACREA9_23205 [Pyrinomonadaceae bacterium]